jgi:subtilisin family serine protease
MCRSALGLITGIVVLLSTGPRSVRAQVEHDFYLHGSHMIAVLIHLDSIAVLPVPAADSGNVVTEMAHYDLHLARTTREGLYVFGLAAPLTREALFDLAMTIETDNGTLAEHAGPLLSMAGSRYTLVATTQVIVKFDPATTVQTMDSLNAAFGVRYAFRTPFEPNHFLLQLVPGSSGDALQIAQAYNGLPMVEYAYPNFLTGSSTALVPNDPLFSDQWHLRNTGANGGTAGADIEAVDAWDLETGDAQTVIAIVEGNGFEVGHPDLAPNLWANPGELGGDEDNNTFVGDEHGWNFGGCVAPGGGVTSASDPGLTSCGSANLGVGPLQHGTAVAGLAAARGNNNTGVTGVCMQCRLMLIRTSMGEYSKYLAFLYAASEGAKVINWSWTQTVNSVIKHAIDEATNNHGIPVVVAANDNMGMDVAECSDPYATFAALPNVIAVSWSDNKDQRMSPSGFGACMGVVAPGAMVGAKAGVTTTDLSGTPGYNSANPLGCPTGVAELSDIAYTRCFGGSSAATPIVSGTIGLMLSHDPTLTLSEITTTLHETAEKVGGVTYTSGFNEYYGYGRVNAFCALGGQGPRCPEAKREVTTETPEATASAVEIGARIGLVTVLNDPTNDETVVNLPGGGPRALPTLYVDWFTGWPLMLDLQFGGARISGTGAADETELAAALQPNWLFPVGGVVVYAGPNVAHHRHTIGTTTNTDWAWGGALGLRYKPTPFLALRVEGRYRYWTSQSIHEWGVAFGFGVVLQ